MQVQMGESSLSLNKEKLKVVVTGDLHVGRSSLIGSWFKITSTKLEEKASTRLKQCDFSIGTIQYQCVISDTSEKIGKISIISFFSYLFRFSV
jgi:GTPase SAR1 family protein